MSLKDLKALAAKVHDVADDKAAVARLADDAKKANATDPDCVAFCDAVKGAKDGDAVRDLCDAVKARK